MLPLSLPSAYGAYGFGGYDPIIEARPETQAFQDKFAASPAEASRAYGIRWVLVANADYYEKEWEYWWAVRKSEWCFGFSDSGWPSYREKFLPAAELRFRREEVSLYELPDASPWLLTGRVRGRRCRSSFMAGAPRWKCPARASGPLW